MSIWKTYSWFGDVLTVSRLQDGADQGLDAVDLTHNDLVPLVVAGQVGEDSGSTGHDIEIIGGEKLYQHL